MKIITLCGSLKFQKEMMTIAEKMALEGYCILTPVYDDNCRKNGIRRVLYSYSSLPSIRKC